VSLKLPILLLILLSDWDCVCEPPHLA
jgi:hypothetical protein